MRCSAGGGVEPPRSHQHKNALCTGWRWRLRQADVSTFVFEESLQMLIWDTNFSQKCSTFWWSLSLLEFVTAVKKNRKTLRWGAVRKGPSSAGQSCGPFIWFDLHIDSHQETTKAPGKNLQSEQLQTWAPRKKEDEKRRVLELIKLWFSSTHWSVEWLSAFLLKWTAPEFICKWTETLVLRRNKVSPN